MLGSRGHGNQLRGNRFGRVSAPGPEWREGLELPCDRGIIAPTRRGLLRSGPITDAQPSRVSRPMTAPDQPTGDEEIVALMRAGEPGGLELLLTVHGGRVRAVLGAMLCIADDHAVEDAVCDAGLVMFRRAHKLDPQHNLGGYLYVSARRLLRRRLKRTKWWHKPLWDGAEEQVAAPAEGIAPPAGRLAERVRKVLECLPTAEREVLGIDLAHDFRIKAKDVARMLGTTQKTVYSTRNRTKGRLQHLLPPPS